MEEGWGMGALGEAGKEKGEALPRAGSAAEWSDQPPAPGWQHATARYKVGIRIQPLGKTKNPTNME